MPAFSGSLMLLKIANQHGEYQTIGGMRTTKFNLSNQAIDISNKSTGQWRHILESAGITSITVAGSGIFTGSESEKIIREIAFKGETCQYQLCFGNGDVLAGPFYITHYERGGNMGEEETYQLSLESAGEIIYTKS